MTHISDVDRDVPLITLKALSKSFGGHQALKNITLTLNKGEVHCLAGANGCGKSTLIKTISGVYAPDDGSEIIIDEKSYHRLTPDRARALGVQVIYQDLSLFPNLTVAENIAFEYNLKGYFGWFNKQKIKQKPARSCMNWLLVSIPMRWYNIYPLPNASRWLSAVRWLPMRAW